MKVIEIKNLHKTYNDSEQLVHAIRGIDLSFEAGEFTAIAGPSGC
jgi:putative ABC transport system ATP-binding protein